MRLNNVKMAMTFGIIFSNSVLAQEMTGICASDGRDVKCESSVDSSGVAEAEIGLPQVVSRKKTIAMLPVNIEESTMQGCAENRKVCDSMGLCKATKECRIIQIKKYTLKFKTNHFRCGDTFAFMGNRGIQNTGRIVAVPFNRSEEIACPAIAYSPDFAHEASVEIPARVANRIRKGKFRFVNPVFLPKVVNPTTGGIDPPVEPASADAQVVK